MMNLGVCIPVCNSACLGKLRAAFAAQHRRGEEVLLLDSAPVPIRAEEWPFGRIRRIPPESFDHGGTRRLAAQLLPAAEILIFLTQDAVPVGPGSIARLAEAFADPAVGAAFGRQLPRLDAGAIEAHARLFNYPPRSRVTSADDIPRLGIKAAFISNSFAAYRRTALTAVGGFPERNIVSEDTLVAARMLHAGWRIVYCAQAQVRHSHAYSLGHEFRRYFDIGVFHAREPWIRTRFGKPEKEGVRFVVSELSFLLEHRPAAIPSALLRLPVRYLGFRAGLAERFLPRPVKSLMSMQKTFWSLEKSSDRSCSRNRPRYSPD